MSKITDALKEKLGNEGFEAFIAKAASCKDPVALVALAKEKGIDVTPDDAKALLDELMGEMKISLDDLEKVAGGLVIL